MPKQRTRSEAGEAGLAGIAVTLLGTGAELVRSDPPLGGALIAAGLLAMFGAIRYRNINLEVASPEVISAINNAASEAIDALSSGSGDPDGESSDNNGGT